MTITATFLQQELVRIAPLYPLASIGGIRQAPPSPGQQHSAGACRDVTIRSQQHNGPIADPHRLGTPSR